MKTREPSSRNRCAAASPIPLLPPLIRTRLPASPRIAFLRCRPDLTSVKVATIRQLVYDSVHRNAQG